MKGIVGMKKMEIMEKMKESKIEDYDNMRYWNKKTRPRYRWYHRSKNIWWESHVFCLQYNNWSESIIVMAGEEKDTFTETGLINVKAFTPWGDITMSLQIHKCWQSVLYSSNLWKGSNGISRAKWSKYSYDDIIIFLVMAKKLKSMLH